MSTQDTRIIKRLNNNEGFYPTINTGSTVPTSDWIETDLMVGEFCTNTVDNQLFLRTNSGIKEIPLIDGERWVPYDFEWVIKNTLTLAEMQANYLPYSSGFTLESKFFARHGRNIEILDIKAICAQTNLNQNSPIEIIIYNVADFIGICKIVIPPNEFIGNITEIYTGDFSLTNATLMALYYALYFPPNVDTNADSERTGIKLQFKCRVKI
jgi:hypothetical protein